MSSSFFNRVILRSDGRPRKPVRRLLFHSSGQPRQRFKRAVLREDGTVRKRFRRWIESAEYQSLRDPILIDDLSTHQRIWDVAGSTRHAIEPNDLSPRELVYYRRLTEIAWDAD